jgi:hypothetical protein
LLFDLGVLACALAPIVLEFQVNEGPAVLSIAFTEHQQSFSPDYTLSQKCPCGVQDSERRGSDEKPEYRPVSLSGYDGADQGKHQHETGKSQISLSFA